jgi:uncharacterized delta-60 repeat protein
MTQAAIRMHRLLALPSGLTATLASLLLAGVLVASPVAATPPPSGSLDPSFGVGGTVVTDFGGAIANDLALLGNGKIVALGTATSSSGTDFALTRYRTNGALDPSFGVGGRVLTDFGGDDPGNAVVIQGDGRVIAAGGSTANGTGNFALARYDAEGSLDATFGVGGKVLTDVGGSSGQAFAVATQADGRIVAAGGNGDFVLARYNADGSLDATFGVGGKVFTDFSGTNISADGAAAVAIERNGKIVAAGISSIGGPPFADFALARYNADGSLDATFGVGGMVLTDFGGPDSANAIALQSDGRIVAAGSSPARIGSDFALARYDADGSLDPGFGVGGTIRTDFGGTDFGNAVAIQDDGRIVTAGRSNVGQGADFALARHDAGGNLDATFGVGGLVLTNFGGTTTTFDEAFAVAIQGNGRIVAAGVSAETASGFAGFGLARYRP